MKKLSKNSYDIVRVRLPDGIFLYSKVNDYSSFFFEGKAGDISYGAHSISEAVYQGDSISFDKDDIIFVELICWKDSDYKYLKFFDYKRRLNTEILNDLKEIMTVYWLDPTDLFVYDSLLEHNNRLFNERQSKN